MHSSDDGEPSGTSGPPVLKMMESLGLTNICIVITRYFGGIKLGTGGLSRAYLASAKGAIEMADTAISCPAFSVEFAISYDALGRVEYFLSQNEDALTINGKDFADGVKIKITIKEDKYDQIISELENLL